MVGYPNCSWQRSITFVSFIPDIQEAVFSYSSLCCAIPPILHPRKHIREEETLTSLAHRAWLSGLAFHFIFLLSKSSFPSNEENIVTLVYPSFPVPKD